MRVSTTIERDVPEQDGAGPVLDRPRSELINIPLDVRPPVRGISPRALSEVDLLGRVGGVESLLLGYVAAVAMELYACEGVASLLHLDNKRL